MNRCLVAGSVAVVLLASLCATQALAVPMSCTFGVVSGVDFGSYDVFSGAANAATGTLEYSCTNVPNPGKTVNIRFTSGNAATYTPRYMLFGGQQLQYNIYMDAGHTIIWGNGTGGTSFYSQTTTDGVVNRLTMFGLIPAGQDLPPGAYSDTITVNMEW